MARPVIYYDYGLPEIEGRLPWQLPDSHLVKDESGEGKWRLVPERRPSPLLLPPQLRAEVDAWRNADYPGASEVSRRLFNYWFEEEHEVSGFNAALSLSLLPARGHRDADLAGGDFRQARYEDAD